MPDRPDAPAAVAVAPAASADAAEENGAAASDSKAVAAAAVGAGQHPAGVKIRQLFLFVKILKMTNMRRAEFVLRARSVIRKSLPRLSIVLQMQASILANVVHSGETKWN